MSKRRLLITGSQGFVGRAVADEVRAFYGDRIELIDFNDPDNGSRLDLRDNLSIDRLFARLQPDAVLHLAAIAAPRRAQRDPLQAWVVNVLGTFNIASAIRRHSAQTRLIWSGSSEAYGNTFNKGEAPIDEDAALEPLSPYGATKAATDIMLRQMGSDGLDVVVFRPFNHTGPEQTVEYVVPAFAEQIARIEAGLQEPIVHVGNLEARRDFLDVRDVAAAYLASVLQAGPVAGKRYNISTGVPVSIREILQMLLSKSTRQIEVSVDPQRFLPNAVSVASGNPQAIRSDLDWYPSIALADTLQSVLDHQRQRLALAQISADQLAYSTANGS